MWRSVRPRLVMESSRFTEFVGGVLEVKVEVAEAEVVSRHQS